MTIKRTAECDVCGALEVESLSDAGWNGWCIIQGISMTEPVGSLTRDNTQSMLCCECKEKVKGFLEKLKEEEEG